MKYFWQFLTSAMLIACQPVTIPPTQTSVPTSTLVPTLETPVRYELRQPPPDDLLKMIDSVLLMEEQMTYSNDVSIAILERESDSLQRLIGGDFERYYLDGFPGAEDLVTSNENPWVMQSFGDLNSFSVVLRIALLQYINNHQNVLENDKSFQLPNVNIKTFSMDLDGDGNLEWLVDAIHQEISLQDWFIIGKQKDGHYHIVPSEISYDQIPIVARDTEIAISDLTGDGNPEIIKVEYYHFAGSISGHIRVYTWKEGGVSAYKFIRLPSVPPVYGELYASEYIIDDFDSDGVDDIHVDQPRFRRFGCQWTQTYDYYLDGRSPDVEIKSEEIPQTDECLIARALESESVVEQIQFYQDTLRKFDANTSSIDKLAWIKLHLAMAYTANGDDIRGASQLQELINMEGEGKFLNFIKNKYTENNSPSPLIFCDALYSSIASQVIPESIGSEIDIDLTHGAYPIDFAPIADLICPFPEVLGSRLANIKISVSESPIDLLTAQGYSFIWTKSLNWDNDSEQEWLGVLDFRQPMLVLIDNDEDLTIDTVEIPSSSLTGFDSSTYISADDAKKVIVLLSGTDKLCDSPNTVKWLIEVSPGKMEYDHYYLCDSNQYSLGSKTDIQFAVEEFSKPNYVEWFDAPNWYYLSNTIANKAERRTILDLVGEIENDVVGQTSPKEITAKISELIASLPKDEPAAQLLLNRLYYLQGLNYELSGQNELAALAYLELIEFSPESLWSKLAETHIQISRP